MSETASNRELADAIKEIFKSRRGEFRIEDLIEVLKEFRLAAIEKRPAHLAGKMYARNNFADIIGTNLEHALEEYEWKEWCPMTINGITITGFWDLSKEAEIPEDYVADESGRYLKHKNLYG